MNKRNEYVYHFNQDNYNRLSLNLHKVNDRDILEAIENEIPGNKQASIKSLIRKSIK